MMNPRPGDADFITRSDTALRAALVILAVVSAVFFVSRIWLPIAIDTNLKNLSPALSKNPHLSRAIDWLSGALEQRFVLLLEANDEDKLFDIAAELNDKLTQLGAIKPQAELGFDQLLPIYAAYPFNFLSPQDRLNLQSISASQQAQQAAADLYRVAVSARLLPLSQDPYNFLSNYLLNLAERVGGSNFNEEGVMVKHIAGKTHYYLPMVYRISQGSLSMTVQEALISRLDTLEKALVATDPAVHLYRSGIVFYAAEAASESKRDISVISIGSSLGVVCLLLFAFASLRTLIIPLLGIVFGIAFAFAVTHSMFSSIHILTIVFGASLIGIVIDYAIHYFFHWPNAQSADKRRILYRALGLSLITSAIGYAALGSSDLLSLKQISVFSCCGLVAAWVCILALSSKLMNANFKPRIQPFLKPLHTIAALFKPLQRLPILLPTTVLLVIFGAILLQGLNTNDNPRTLFQPSKYLMHQDQKVSEILSDYEPGKYLVIYAENEAALFAQLTQLHTQTQDFQLMTLLHWLPPAEVQRSNHALQQALYRSGGGIEDFFGEFGVATTTLRQIQQTYSEQSGQTLSPATLFQKAQGSIPPLWVSIADRHYAFALIPKGTNLLALQQALQGLPNTDYIDTLQNASAALRDQRIAASLTLVAAFASIGAVLLLRYRKLSCLNMLCVPLCSCLAVIICLHSFGIGITLFHSVALFLVLGLGMDYIIFSRESGAGDPNTMAAIGVSTLTSLLSFGLLATSSLSIVSAIGSTVLIGNLCNFVAVLASYTRSAGALNYT
ncbi:MAG: hypothetical protein KTR17_08525 [Cellvibrionaceae bacterium]|nr:hypothetical protein [Cellvibrionaceae bacterium]